MHDNDLQHLAAIVRDSGDAIIGMTLEGVITSWNGGAERIYGYTPQEAIGRTMAMLVPPDRQDELPTILQKLSQGEGINQYDTLRVTKDGILVNISLTVSPIREPSGTIIGASSIGRDVTKEKESEAALRESARAYQLLMEEASEAIFTADHEGHFLDANSRALEMLGYTKDELLQLSVTDIISDEDRDKLAAQWEETLYAGNTLVVERLMHRKDGTQFHAESSSKMLGDGRLQAIVRNISERKLAQDALRESEERYRAILEQVSEAIFLIDPDTKRFVSANPAFCKLLGYTFEELAEIQIYDVLPYDRERVDRAFLRILNDGHYRVSDRLYRRKDGSLVQVEVGITPVSFAGKQVLCEVVRDITERKAAEEELRASEEKFRAIFDNTLDALFITDDVGNFVDVNPAASRLIGQSAEQLVGRNYADFQFWKPTTELLRLRDQVAERGQASGDLQFIGADGETRDVDYFSKSNFIPGFHLSVAHDLTERRRTEEAKIGRDAAERANQAKNEFLSRMSHELRTPLNAILGFGQLLQMDTITPEQQESAGYILKAGKHLLSLINEVLDIARIEEGKLDFSMEPVLVRDVIQESLDLVQPLAATRNIDLKADVAYRDNCCVLADQQRLQQVMLNLLANAIKYNHEGGLVTISCSEEDAALVRISVSDTGPGLSPDKMARLFTPFERLGAEQGEVEGTGLGLALSKHLVEAMGGAIGVESEEGAGSTFWVELPPADEQMPDLERTLTGPLSSLLAPHSSILYIEDNLSNLRLIQRILRDQPGVVLITAMQGQIGLDMAQEHRPDLILLDLHLPDMTGNEVLARLRANPTTASIPVVVLSADASPKRIDRLLEAGAQAYLTKPLNVKHLLKVLARTED